LLAGGLARVWGTDATFPILKVLSMVFGILILLLFYKIVLQESTVASWISFALVAFSPWLVDYSANGSPYSLIAFLLFVSQWLWRHWGNENMPRVIGAAVLSGMAWLTHGILIALPFAFIVRFFCFNPQKMSERVKRVSIFLVIFFLLISPWLLWNQATYGRLFYSSSNYYLLEQLGMAQVKIHDNAVQWVVHRPELIPLLHTYLVLISKAAYAGLREALSVITSWGIVLILVSLFLYKQHSADTANRLAKTNWKGKFLTGLQFFFSPLGLYMITVFLWATYKLRFLIPLLPFAYIEIGKGCEKLIQQKIWYKWLGWGLTAGVLVGMALPYFQARPNLYYGTDTKRNSMLYDQMQPLALELGQLPHGVVLGIANSLDGGIETIYWARQPFVTGRGMNEVVLRKLASDFTVAYLWADRGQEDWVRDIFPQAHILEENAAYTLYHLEP
jgi:4-amino-4-deoxy-L-arabinose transferase-like glycosyltransferase